MAPHIQPPPLDRAKARLDLLVDRLAKAKDTAEPMPIDAGHAAALYSLAWDAIEDLNELTRPPRMGAEKAGA